MKLNRIQIENVECAFEGCGPKGLWQAATVQAVKDATYPIVSFSEIMKIDDYFVREKQYRHFQATSDAIAWLQDKSENVGSFRWIGLFVEDYQIEQVVRVQDAFENDPIVMENLETLAKDQELQEMIGGAILSDNIPNMIKRSLLNADTAQESEYLIALSESFTEIEVVKKAEIAKVADRVCRGLNQLGLFI